MALKTPIYEAHLARGARMVEFAGFMMPVSFEGIIAEHERVRGAAGLFDVSHMGEIEITGPGALEFADYVVTNNVAKLEPGQICYTVCCNDGGGVLDDLLVYRFSDERILFVVNAVNTAKIYAHLTAVLRGELAVKSAERLRELTRSGVEIRNLSARTAQIAVQGPRSRDLLLSSGFFRQAQDEIAALPYYRFCTFEHDGSEVILSRTGYTGELGYEIYLPPRLALGVWNELLGDGRFGASPIGLGARDTLRFEPAFCLYGHELDEKTSPLEAGLAWVVKLKKGAFVGRESLAAQAAAGAPRGLIGLEVGGRAVARQGFPVALRSERVGAVTSGTFGPTLKKSLAIASVSRAALAADDGFTVEIRGTPVPVRRVSLPFYKSRSAE